MRTGILFFLGLFAISGCAEPGIGDRSLRGVHAGMLASDLIAKLSDDFPDQSTLSSSPNWSDYEIGDIRPLSKCAETIPKQGRKRCSAGFDLFNMRLNGTLTWQDRIEFTALNGFVIEVNFQQTSISGNSEKECNSQQEDAIEHYTEIFGEPTSARSGRVIELEWRDSDNETSYAESGYEGVQLRISCNNIYDTNVYTISLGTSLKSARAEEKAKRQVFTSEQRALKL